MSINKVILIGRLGQDPELKYTAAGTAVTNFSVATNESWMDKSGQRQERTEWHRIVVWGKLAELCQQYLAKGRQAFIEGSLRTRSWEDQSGQKRYTTEVVARNIQFLGTQTSPSGNRPDQGPGATANGNGNSEGNQTGVDSSYDANSNGNSNGQDYNNNNAGTSASETNFTADDIPF